MALASGGSGDSELRLLLEATSTPPRDQLISRMMPDAPSAIWNPGFRPKREPPPPDELVLGLLVWLPRATDTNNPGTCD